MKTITIPESGHIQESILFVFLPVWLVTYTDHFIRPGFFCCVSRDRDSLNVLFERDQNGKARNRVQVQLIGPFVTHLLSRMDL